MIYVNVRGNLGNQLFEYACARMLQQKYNQQIILCTYNLKKYRKEYTYNLDGYILNENVIEDEKKKFPWFANLRNPVLKLIRKLFPNAFFNVMKNFGIFINLGIEYKEIPNKKFKNIYLDGYFQSDKYFNDIRDIILKEFTAIENINENNRELYENIRKTQSVCVTIRRGDYITNKKYRDNFFVCDEDYFYRGINKIKELIPDCTFFIFSDDIEWAKENLKIDSNVFFESGKDSVFEKLRMMAECKNFIISNSSFSWWAQYLSNNDNKIVIAPTKWYADGRRGDIYQRNWIEI